MSITSGRKDLSFCQNMICGQCGKYGRYSVYMTYTVLSLFFIPCFKWNRRYYVTTSCCNTRYELNPDIGKRIARGESIEITKEDLTRAGKTGWYLEDRDQEVPSRIRRCAACGFATGEDYDYCPKCGSPLE